MEEQTKSENQPVIKKKKGKKIFIGIIGIILLAVIVNALSSDPKDETAPASTDSVQVEDKTPVDASKETPTETSTPTATMGEQNALNKAADYLAYASFSHSGLISQLEYEGFSTEEATYAVDNCGADWSEQAAQKAKEYIEYSSFSRSSLIDQLEYEGFTAEQAEYGATAIGY